jgi:hypothetical protein
MSMRIDSDAYLATRAVEERNDAELSADAQAGDAQQEAGSQPAAAPPAAAEAGVQTLRVMARESEGIVRRFERPMRQVSEPVDRESLPARTPAAQAVATLAATTTVAAAPSLPAAPPASAPVAAPPAASSYVGERPVDASWLADREKALTAIRADYESVRAQAQSTQGSGPGWVAAVTVTDESGQVRSASGRALVFVADPNAPQVVAGYDESGPIYRPNGQWMEFDEDAFAAHYRAQGGAQLQGLAALYGTDSATLFAQHPEIWRIATSDHALNAGPPPAGRAMGDPGQLGMLDLYMADPQIAGLIQAYGGQPQPATSDIAREQVRIYGQERYDQLTKLGHAMDSVRQQYTDAMAQAQASGAGPGWVERARTITVTDESGQHTAQTVYVTDESGQPLRDASGQPQAVMERIFDPDAFTAWYEQQGGLQHQAFANFYGASHSTYATDESGRTFASNIAFDNPNWSMYGVGGAMGHKDLIGINPNAPPDLRNREAVGFDLEAGWATAHGNIKEKRDWFETVVQVAMVAVVSYVSAGTLGPAAAGAMGLSTTTVAGAMVSAAVAGAATSVASGMMSGNLTLKGVLQGALAGGLSAGLMTQFGPAVNSVAGSAGTLALRTTVQGGIQALLGGHFKDGALAGFAGGLADMASANMQANISEAVKNGTMDATQAASARMFARVMGSAIRAMGNPDDPSHAFASAFLTDVMKESGAPVAAPVAFDDEGNLMPGIVDPAASPQDQKAQLQARLEAQGLSSAQAAAMAQQYFDRLAAGQVPDGPAQPTTPVAGNGNSEAVPLPIPERIWETSRQDDSGRVVERTVWYGDSKALSYRSDIPGQYTMSVADDRALVRDGSGALFLVSATEAQKDTWTIVIAAGQTVMSNGLQSLTLPANATPETLAMATLLTAPVLVADGALGLGAAGTGASLGRVVAGWGPTALRALGTIGLALWPSSLGGGESVVQINDNTRIVRPSGDVIAGYLELRGESGQWLRVQDRQFRPDDVAALLATQRTSMLTPEEVRTMTGPLITVPVPPPPATPGGYLPLPENERPSPVLPGPPMDPPQIPSVEIYPAADPAHWSDNIITKDGNADNNANLAADRYRRNPSLSDPSSLAGQSLPGVGTWVHPETPRSSSGSDYQEERTGVPAGLELNVGGTIRTTSNGSVTAEGGANFDGVRVSGGGQPVLIDTKDWQNYVLPETKFWRDAVVNEAARQVDAAATLGSNVSIEWQVSTQAAADAIRAALASTDFRDKIDVVYVPKKGS